MKGLKIERISQIVRLPLLSLSWPTGHRSHLNASGVSLCQILAGHRAVLIARAQSILSTRYWVKVR